MSKNDESRSYGLRRRSRCYSDDDTEEIPIQSHDRLSYNMRRVRSFDGTGEEISEAAAAIPSRLSRRPRPSVRLVEFKSCTVSTLIQIAILLVIAYLIYDSNVEDSTAMARFQKYRDDGLKDGLKRLEKRAAELQDQIERLNKQNMKSSQEL